jgi:hypothetical protein
MSPFTGGGLLGPGWGIALDSKGQVWIGDYGWGNVNPTGTVSVFNSEAQPVFMFGVGVYRVQGIAVDDADNVWIASHGNGQVVVIPGAGTGVAIIYSGDPDSFKPFSISIAADGSAWVTSSDPQGSITNLRLHNGKLECLHNISIGNTNRGMAIDSAGNIWVASSGDDHVYALDNKGAFIGGYQGGGIAGPWGVTLDGNDNVWVGNLGPLEVGSVFTGRLTQLAGSRENNGHRMGDALSPQTGYTVPSAGSQVLLHDGTPLYGKNGPPVLHPDDAHDCRQHRRRRQCLDLQQLETVFRQRRVWRSRRWHTTKPRRGRNDDLRRCGEAGVMFLLPANKTGSQWPWNPEEPSDHAGWRLAKELRALLENTRMPFFKLSKTNVSPGWTPSAWRMPSGIVIWPLDVIRFVLHGFRRFLASICLYPYS